MAAVGEIEGLIDEREIRDDVADDGVLEHRPVLPRRIVRVTAADRARRVPLRARRTPDRASLRSVLLRRLRSAGTRTGARWGPIGSVPRMRRMRRQDSCSSSKRTATRAATSPSLRPIFTGASSVYGSHGRSTRRSNAWALARPARPVSPKTRGELGSDDTGAGESIAHALVLVVDRTQGQRLVCQLVHTDGEPS